MSTAALELAKFKQFLEAQIAAGRADLTPEELVRIWRASGTEPAESVQAVQRALDSLDRGDRGRPLDEFIDDFRAQHQIPVDA